MAELEENRWYRIRRRAEPLDDAYPLIRDDFTYSSSSCVMVNNKLYVFGSNQQQENFGKALIPRQKKQLQSMGEEVLGLEEVLLRLKGQRVCGYVMK